ncbi:MAG: cyclase family protein [Actinomycetota bacterium]|nr:cyclase family protein [Actinomycetota bacterium]
MNDTPLPSYDELPIRPGAPAGSSWGVWGDDDRYGCLNLLTEERATAAAALVRSGRSFALNLEYELPDPPLFGRQAPHHEVLGEGGHDDVLHFNTQSSSQWDGFRHVQHPAHGHYNGIADAEHGMHLWGAKGMVGRAVLVDVARHCDIDPSTSTPITVDDLDATLLAEDVTVQTGDILLLRTGWVTWYRSLDRAERDALPQELRAPGLRPGQDMLRWLWDHHIAALGVDNPAVEIWPPAAHLTKDERDEIRADPDRIPELFMHTALLPLLGLPLGELWDLDALAADCAADGVYEGLFTSAPLRVQAGVASPPNAMFVK